MATQPDDRGNSDPNSPERRFTRAFVNQLVAKHLGKAMRAQQRTTDQLEKLTTVPERRIEKLRSFTEETPVYFEDILALGEELGERFLTGLISEIGMYAATYNGSNPEKIAAEIIVLAGKITGGDGK